MLNTSSKLAIKSYLGPFAITFVIFMFILIMQGFWLYIDELIGKGLGFWIIAEFLLYTSAGLVEYALPLTILLSSTMMYGNLAEHNELVAFKSTGVSFLRTTKPLVVIVLLVSITAFYFSNNISPMAQFKMQVLRADILNTKPTVAIKENQFYSQIDGLSIRVGKKHDDVIEDVTIYQYPLSGDGNKKRLVSKSPNRVEKKTILAERGKMNIDKKNGVIRLELENGEIYEEIDETAFKDVRFPYQRYKFKKTSISIPLSGFNLVRSSENEYGKYYKYFTLNQLGDEIDSTKNEINAIQKKLNTSINTRLSDTSKTTTSIANYAFNKLSKPVQKRDVKHSIEKMRSTLSLIASRKLILEGLERNLRQINIERHKKFVLSLSCILLFFIGAPMGAIVKRGGLGMPIVITVVFFILYFILTTAGQNMAVEGVLPISLSLWLSSIVLFPIAVFLTIKGNNDSKIFDKDFYLRLFKLKKVD